MNDKRIPVPGDPAPSALRIALPNNVEVIRIAADGRLYWRGREVVTDADFRAAMLDLAATMGSAHHG